MDTFDLVVIGAGPGGYVAAIRAAQLGLKTAVVEKEHLGGICLNWGCIPTKALLRSAEVYQLFQHANEYGINVSNVSFDLKKIVERSRNVSNQLAQGVKHLLKKNKVTVFDGIGTLKGSKTVMVKNVDGKTIDLAAKNIIIATGARPRVLPSLEADGKYIWTYKEAMIPETLPKKLLVVGSGAIGSEFASFYNAFGSDVTIVEVMDQILPQEDDEISQRARKAFEAKGIKILTNTTVQSLKVLNNKVEALLKTAEGEQKDTFDRVITAVGVVGNIENIGLENTKIKTEHSRILTDEFCETNEPGVYAIGDVVAGPWLAHKASHEGILCAEKIAGKKPHVVNKLNIPGCTYTSPQIASIGLTEKKAKELGYELNIGRFSAIGNGKSIALGEMDGFVKTIFDKKTGELLGAHLIGPEVTEMIQGFGVAKTLETTESELMHTIFAHPTLSEMIHESVLDAYGRAIHL
ncbi:MAG: dihydrolipoyl dehydrogenase [Candidatus Paracaedibacteraceae bacterium]|nr:dihydrolipoyl dehydrogenase [Candidatus Paracaedibacteraceae bacterium]